MRHLISAWVAACAALLLASPQPKEPARIVDVKAIWSRAPHNAFTDLIRFKNRWYCVFREGKAHVSPGGGVRVLTSLDGEVWVPDVLLTSGKGDLRDPKLSITSDHRLMLNAVIAMPQPGGVVHQSVAWFSYDGRGWSEPEEIGDFGMWLWRVTWHNGRSYSMGYGGPNGSIRLYTSLDGAEFTTLAEKPFDGPGGSEATLLFLPDNSALCLLRRDGEHPTAQLGKALPPYRGWTWKDLGRRIGGPNMIQLPDGRIVAAGRLSDGKDRTSLCWLDPEEGKLTEFLTLPSGGDNGYPGLVFYDGLLWVSYYSSHQGQARIYLAKVKIAPPQEERPASLSFSARE